MAKCLHLLDVWFYAPKYKELNFILFLLDTLVTTATFWMVRIQLLAKMTTMVIMKAFGAIRLLFVFQSQPTTTKAEKRWL